MAVTIPSNAARGTGAPHTHSLYRMVVERPYAIFNPGDHACFEEQTAIYLVEKQLARFAIEGQDPIPVPVEPKDLTKRVRVRITAPSLNNTYSFGDEVVMTEAEAAQAYMKGWAQKIGDFDQAAFDAERKKTEANKLAREEEERSRMARVLEGPPANKAIKSAPASK